MIETPERDWRAAAIATIGGGALVLGALLPWMSLFAGLQSYAGVAGVNGRLLLAGGMWAICGGIAMAVRPWRGLRRAIGALGVFLGAFALWILSGLRMTIHELAHHPLLLARPGPGVFVALAGALVVTSLIIPLPRRRL